MTAKIRTSPIPLKGAFSLDGKADLARGPKLLIFQTASADVTPKLLRNKYPSAYGLDFRLQFQS